MRSPSPAFQVAVLAALVVACGTTTRGTARTPTGAEHAEFASNEPAEEHAGHVAAGATDVQRAGGPRARTGDRAPTGDGQETAETPATVREAVSGAVTAGRLSQGTSRALQAIAGMLERAAGGSSPAAASIERMRGETAALEELGAVDLDRAEQVKAALDRGVEAMRALARSLGEAWLDPWVDAAATAVDVVDPATPLGLQRAAIQDALRSLADAVLVAAQFASRSPSPPPLRVPRPG